MANKVAIYCRLSEEDRDKKNKDDDSGSIGNQKLMLSEYAGRQGWEIYKIYVDDDYAGSDRNRPAFNRMLTEARTRNFDIILCKTQSRFTRELEIVEKYIHGLFPEWGIRFVSIVDNIDTAVAGNKKTRQINGLINEWYLEDMSDSIKAALKTRMKAGYFIGSFAPYGYQKDPDRRGHLIIDEEAAVVVREIFRLYNQGVGRTAIAKKLNERGVPSPAAYYRMKGIKNASAGKNDAKHWKYDTVSHILKNEVYIGHLVQGKTHNPTYKSKHSVPSAHSDWVKIENAHQPIIDMDTWQTTRRLWQERSKPCYDGSLNKYAGVLICSRCGYHMGVAYNRHQRYYRCNNAKYGVECCQGTSIFETTLDKAVLREAAVLRDRYLNRDSLTERNDIFNAMPDKTEFLQKQIRQLSRKAEESVLALKNLYMDKLRGVISEQQFRELSDAFTAEKEECLSKIQLLNDEIAEEQAHILGAQQKKRMIEELTAFTEITRSFITAFIDKIEVGGTKTERTIHIYWKF